MKKKLTKQKRNLKMAQTMQNTSFGPDFVDSAFPKPCSSYIVPVE